MPVPRLEEVLVLALASTRIARAISVDEITRPARERLARAAERPGGGRWRDWTHRLVDCPLCVGWWTSLAVSLVAPGRQRLLRGAAVAGAQVMLTLAERLISEEGRTAIHVADRVEAELRDRAAPSTERH